MRIRNLGHACWHIDLGKTKLLIDPFISGNPLASNIDIDSIECDYILVTHGHEDHVADVVRIAQLTNATVVSNFEIVNWFQKQGLSKLHPMNIGGSWNFDFGKLTYFTAQHSSVMPDGSPGGNPGSFIIQSDHGNFYHAGDTGLMMDMKIIPMLVKLDFALLPIGDNFTMGINEAIIASQWIECNNIIAMHYDTFGYIVVDQQKAKSEFQNNGINLTFIEIGESINI